MQQTQYIRRVSLVVFSTKGAPELATVQGNGLDLSQMHFTFETSQQDAESPNSAAIRVFNLSDQTIKRIQGEFDSVVLQAGYANGPFGIIFKGNIKQYRIG